MFHTRHLESITAATLPSTFISHSTFVHSKYTVLCLLSIGASVDLLLYNRPVRKWADCH